MPALKLNNVLIIADDRITIFCKSSAKFFTGCPRNCLADVSCLYRTSIISGSSWWNNRFDTIEIRRKAIAQLALKYIWQVGNLTTDALQWQNPSLTGMSSFANTPVLGDWKCSWHTDLALVVSVIHVCAQGRKCLLDLSIL